MNSVMLKAKGVKNISRAELLGFNIPESTSSYCPVSNLEIIETTLEHFDKNGFIVKDEFHKRDGSCNKFVGGFIVSGGNKEADLMFGYKNSYDRSMSAAFALGASIMVCSNSVVTGEVSLIRRHTGRANNDMIMGISEGIKRLGENFMNMEKQLQAMKEIEISKRIAASLIGRLFIEEEIITAHQLAVLKNEYFAESFDYGITGTLYNLYQDVTHSLKTSHPRNFLGDHIDAHKFFVEASGIIQSPVKPLVFEDTNTYGQMSWIDEIIGV
jgi:hypothetical protein